MKLFIKSSCPVDNNSSCHIYIHFPGDHANFALDETTGWITVKNPLDRDDEAVMEKGGVYAMYVQVGLIPLMIIGLSWS